ncbi:RNA methyltransferase [Desulfovibrio sp. MES5]|uniref:RNA methyltransferase n=1 Tax=Desulfovibrio sp. MES5 TaxID=1899016 RepID=UPI0025C6ED4D|nr:RNA methyltransferase [Desulfovibrio sp. MES5]
MASLLDGLDVVLVKTRFPENIGMAARACVNMGCSSLRLVDPERWDREKARPLATPKGQDLLDGVTVSPELSEAVAPTALVVGTTARVGGWRQSLLSPAQAAAAVAEVLARGERVALVFGPEDRGLNNEEITHCHKLTTIPTDPAASSLNLAQAVLLLLYECANAVRNCPKKEGGRAPGESGGGKLATAAEQERLMESLKDMLLRLDYLHGDNPDYFLMPWRRLFTRAGLRRHEYDALMGLCRQVRHKLG